MALRTNRALKRIAGIAVCSLAAVPFILLLESIDDAINARSAGHLLDRVNRSLGSVLLHCAAGSLTALPVVVAFAIGMHLLGKFGRDSLTIALGTGIVIGYSIIWAIGLALFGQGLSFDFGQYRAASDTVMVVSLSAFVSALYWLTVVRHERSLRKLSELGSRAIHAME